MGSGLSMASVNKIKELAEQREYSLALDIVESQDLSKSLNPQFLRVCGEIYINNERYKDARKVLLMAHKLAPEGKRVIYSLTYLYLKMGYEKLAEKYYNLYLFDADEFNPETNQIKYIYNKANKCEPEELEEFLCPQYIHNLDYDWSFEAFLLLALLDKKQEMKVLASDFIATYKNSEYSKCIENIMNGKASAEDYYYVFPEEKRADDDPEQEELRQEEKILLKADDLRVNPREAEITIMVDDFEEVDIGTQRRLKKFLKNEEKAKKKEKKKEKELSEDSEGEENDSEETELKSLSDGENQENAATENAATEEAASEEDSKEDADKEVSEDAESEDAPVEKKKVKGLFKKVFSKKKKQSDELEEDAEETEETDQVSETEKTESEDNNQEEKTEETPDNESEEASVEDEKADTDVSEDESSDEVSGTEGQMVDTSVDVAEDSPKEEEEVLMREIHTNKHNPKVSIDFDDNDFAAESDTIEGLKDEDFSNPFDSISAFKKEKEEPAFVPKRKTEFSFDDIDLSTDEDEEFEVDDFSSDEDEFGKMEVALEDSEGYTEEYTEAEPEEEEIEEEFEEEVEVEPEVEVEVEETYEEEYAEESTEESTEDYAEENTEAEPEEEEIEEESEVEEVEVEPEVEVEVEETYAEEYAEESTEEYTEDYAEENTEAEPEEEEIEEIKEEIQEEPEVRNDYIPEPQKKKLDYPVFRSSLFPNHNKEVKQVENNFNEIMTKGQDKIQENLLKEEQMQREAEALLASLGIDLSSITVTSDSIDSINATLYNEPSRDELKASLKIDSVKKNILKQLKEYR